MNAQEWTEAAGLEPVATAGGLDLWGMVVRRKFFILFGAVVGIALGYLYASRLTPIYESSARVLVIKQDPKLPIDGFESRINPDESIATHSLMLRSPAVIQLAVQKHKLGSLPSFVGVEDPTGPIVNGLSVLPVSAGPSVASVSNVLDLRFRSPSPKDCSTVVNAVMDSYADFLGDTYDTVSKQMLELINKAKDDLHLQLQAKEAHYREFVQKKALFVTSQGATNLHEQRLQQIEGQRSAAHMAQIQTQAQITAIQEALKRGENRQAILLMIAKGVDAKGVDGKRADAKPGEDSSKQEDQLFPLLVQEKMLLENYGPDYPKVKTIRKQIELVSAHLRSRLDGGMEKGKANPAAGDLLDLYLASLNQELKMSKVHEDNLTDYFNKEYQAANALSVSVVEDSTIRNDITRTQQMFDAVLKRLQEINLVKSYGGYKTKILSPAGYGYQVEPNITRILTMALCLGLFGGLGLGYLVEIADRTFRSPDEIRRLLGVPVVGHVPAIPLQLDGPPAENALNLSPSLCTVHKPKSSLAEAFRAVRTALYFSAGDEKHRVIQITSPDVGDGKSTLSANLAVSIAQSGKRTLLVDADFRRPRIHKLFGLKRDEGLSNVISGDSDLPDAVQSSAVENLWILACGAKVNNPAELLTSPEFADLVKKLREEYDFVIIDTPPVLAVTDPCAVAPRVDGVLFTLRISRNVRPKAQRTQEILQSLGAKVLGVVVNGIGVAGEYGYGKYYGSKYYHTGYYGGYGYRNGYGGGNGYGYYENSYKDYYTEDEKETTASRTNGATRTIKKP